MAAATRLENIVSQLYEKGVQRPNGTLTLQFMDGGVEGVRSTIDNQTSGALFVLLDDMQWVCVKSCMPFDAFYFDPFKQPPEEPPVDLSTWEEILPLIETVQANVAAEMDEEEAYLASADSKDVEYIYISDSD